MIFKEAKDYSSPPPPTGVATGRAPCIETFVFEAKNYNCRPFFSLNFLKIRLKITKKKWVGPIFLEGEKDKDTPAPPPPHTPKIAGAYLCASDVCMVKYFKSI